MYIDPRKINLQDAAGMQLVELIRNLGDAIEALPYDETPAMAGEGSAGESNNYARGDHQHPSDTSKLDVSDGERIENEALNAYPVNEAHGGVVRFDDGSGLKANEVIVGIVPVQSGSGDPAPDNVRSISGWTGANVYRTGKNLFDGSAITTTHTSNWGITWEDETLTIEHKNTYSTGTPTLPLLLKPGTYTIKCATATGEFELRKNGAYLAAVSTSAVQFTVEAGDSFMLLFYNANASTFVFNKIQLELGSSATDYEAYKGTIIPISWETEAGTVYGGTLNATTGVLTVTHTLYTITSDMLSTDINPSKEGNLWCVRLKSPLYGSDNDYKNGLCDKYAFETSYVGVNGTNNSVAFNYAGGDQFIIRDDAFDSSDDVYAAMPINVCYPLATPEVYQLTPTEVELLVGYNALWCDTGDVSVKYKADTTTFVNNAVNYLANILEKIITANIETEMKATKNYTANDLIIANGNLYKASSNIASGATLAVGTNVTATTIAAELASISVGG